MKLSSTSCWKLAKVSTEEGRMWAKDSLPPEEDRPLAAQGEDIEAKVKVEVMNLHVWLAVDPVFS